MKNFFALMLLISQVAFAGELVVFEKPIFEMPTFQDSDAIFQVNQTTSEGYLRLTASRLQRRRLCSGPVGERDCLPDLWMEVVFSQNVAVPDLRLEGDKLIYRGPMGSVECATLGRSRVFRRPTLFMSGACEAKTAVVKKDGFSVLQLKFITKE